MMGPLAKYTGYAVGFRGLVGRLVGHRELDFQLRATKGQVPEDTDQYFLDLIAKNGNYDRMGIAFGYPTIAQDICTRYHCIYTMYEADHIPEGWQWNVEKADEVWVPNPFNAEVFGRYNPRIVTVPWGIDTRVFKKGKSASHSGFIFGAVGVQSNRKGTDILVETFTKTFGGNPDIRLIIKTRDTRSMPRFDNPSITVIDEDWPEERLVQFYRDMDCLVECSRGEGIGCPPLQAAFCGTPAIATAWGGMAEYVDDAAGIFGLRILGLVPATGMSGNTRARWAAPDPRHLAELMQMMVDSRPKPRPDRLKKWTLDNMTKEFVGCLHSAWGRAGR